MNGFAALASGMLSFILFGTSYGVWEAYPQAGLLMMAVASAAAGFCAVCTLFFILGRRKKAEGP